MNDVLTKKITSKSPMHMVLVVDDSGSMRGDPAALATKALRAWVSELDVATQGTRPYFRFSLIQFGSQPTIVAENLDVRKVDVTDFQLAGESGSTNLAAALNAAREVLLRDGATSAHCPPFVFLFTDGHPTDSNGHTSEAATQAALDAAGALKVLPLPCGSPFLVALGYGDINDDNMRKLASRPDLYHRLPNMAALVKVLPSIGTPTVQGGGTVGTFVAQIAGGIQER
ncbi:VWA domain-containing protein [Polyangium sp. 15x6]|uniref:VWA domain-containing protein n=1 Tax=Polyangium sp. 15x6 TaxID=3042687 RepID=UPI00249B304E|nr:VWA domain-containing protein [Polyangium sp. 15x6]MDI3291656.1 VWA domain-containing protein [Polyangium sp. 15x6]